MLIDQVEAKVAQALKTCQSEGSLPLETLPEVKVETPRDASHGDYATNVAMTLAKPCRMAPRKIAETLLPHLQGPPFEAVDIAGPGFINFRLAQDLLQEGVAGILKQGENFGQWPERSEHHYLLEFVSANPTGPLHFGHGRWAVLGDCLARLMRKGGYKVDTEFYINDMGAQIQNLGKSVMATYFAALKDQGHALSDEQSAHVQSYLDEKTDLSRKVSFYHGEGIETLGQGLADAEGDAHLNDEVAWFSDYAKAAILKEQQAELESAGVTFNCWFPESQVHADNAVAQTLEDLNTQGQTYEQEGALWFKASAFDEKEDRVLVKNTGATTYFANDIAYHRNKLKRGYDRLINIWGADHHGYIPRMSSAIQALGHPKAALEVILGQMVNLYRDGEKVRMSKRTGDVVTFGEVLEEVGKDATRFLLMQRSADSTLDFDLTLAKEQTSENPVFYVQYAHARICSIFRTAQGIEGFDPDQYAGNPTLLTDPAERNLMVKLLSYPDEVRYAADVREPHRLALYVRELAAAFHQFYKQCRVLLTKDGLFESEADRQLTEARLLLAHATRLTIQNILVGIFGISAPESM